MGIVVLGALLKQIPLMNVLHAWQMLMWHMCDYDNKLEEPAMDKMSYVIYVDLKNSLSMKVVSRKYLKNPSSQLLENSSLPYVPSSPAPSSMSSWLNPLKILRKEHHKNLSIHLDMGQF